MEVTDALLSSTLIMQSSWFLSQYYYLCISGQVMRASDLGTQVQLIVSDKEEVKRSIQAFQRCQ